MGTLEFLNLIMPQAGVRFAVIFREHYPQPQHRAFDDNESLANFVREITETEPEASVYHACATYKQPFLESQTEEGKTRKKYRVADNWHKAQTFWVDIDCGQEKFDKGQGYLTKSDAAKAIMAFSDRINWPRPMLVDSGYGLHAYWPLDRAINHTLWGDMARALKSALAYCEVIADPTRTADFASILRPVGASNNKHGTSKIVTAKNTVTPGDVVAMAAALKTFVVANPVKQIAEPKRTQVANLDLNSDLTAHLQTYPDLPVDADLMASQCNQVFLVKSTKGDSNYEQWRGVIGLLKFSENGRKLAKEWSSERGNTGHSQVDWDIRYDTWESGPTTCDHFKTCNPSGCSNCPMNGKVKTPLVLGRYAPESVETTAEIVDDSGSTVEVEVPAKLEGYEWDADRNILYRSLKNKEGVLVTHPFCSQNFYPTTRIRSEDGTYRIGIRIHMPNKKVRDIEMSSEAMASQTDMLRALAKYELFQTNHKDAGIHMAAYLRDQLQSLKSKVEEVNTMTTFGWKNDNTGFLIGDRLYHKDGSTRKVLVGGSAAKFAASLFTPKGTVEGYAAALNFMYNRKGAEHWQYAVCSGWGSILTPFCEELYKGLLVALYGGDSGKGKTTVCYASLFAFGDAERMTLKSKEGFTYNALWAFLGAYNNVPVLLDEFTNMEPSVFSDVAYGVSRGEEKVRLTSKGGTVGFADTATWRLAPFVTGNKDFHGLLAASQANSQAEAVRLIQISVDRYQPVSLHEDAQIEAEMVHQAVDGMKANAGCAGEALVKYVTTHQRQVADKVRSALNDMVQYIPGTKYRYYRNHAACTLTIAQIAKDLGIIDFDIEVLKEFSINLLRNLAETVNETNTVTVEDAFSRMVSSMANRIVVTGEYRDRRSTAGVETPRTRVMGEIAGRFVLGSNRGKSEFAGWLMLAQKDVREWCVTNRTEYNAMLDHLEREGALLRRSEKLTLTRGTDLPTIQARCIVVDTRKLDKEHLTLVVNQSDNEAMTGAV